LIDEAKQQLLHKAVPRRGLAYEAHFLVPDWGGKVDYGIELSYRPARLHYRLEGQYDNPVP
jgi:hypothetical protein